MLKIFFYLEYIFSQKSLSDDSQIQVLSTENWKMDLSHFKNKLTIFINSSDWLT